MSKRLGAQTAHARGARKGWRDEALVEAEGHGAHLVVGKGLGIRHHELGEDHDGVDTGRTCGARVHRRWLPEVPRSLKGAVMRMPSKPRL